MTIDKPSLLPCPFCGSQPELMEGHRNHWRVECLKCGVRRAQFANGGVSEDQARAIAAWNRRTIEPQQGLVEHLVREAYEEGVEDGAEWATDRIMEPSPQWIDSVARVELIKASRAAMTPPQQGWRDIGSAPKDGTRIDLWVVFPEPEASAYRCPGCKWNDEAGEWQLRDFHVGQYKYRPAVTHWMPFPDPPQDNAND